MIRLISLVFALVISFSCGHSSGDINTQLIEAVKDGDIGKVRVLIAKGAYINTTDDKGGTPLHWAAYYGRKDIAKLLLMQGADINQKDKYGLTPVDVARINQKREILELFKRYKSKNSVPE